MTDKGGDFVTSISISVVVPALNEEKTLRKTVVWTNEVLQKLAPDSEIIIVDDGSTDGTTRIAAELAREYATVNVIRNEAPTGYGGALNTGFQAATKDVITIITADCEFWPTELPGFIAEMTRTNADVVTSTVPNRPYPLYRKFLSWGWRLAMKIFLGECPTLEGIFMMRRSVFADVTVAGRSGMWAMELLIRTRRNGATFSVIPIELHPREDLRESKVANFRTILKHFQEILELRQKL